MQPCHTRAATSARFDDPNLLSAAGLIPVLALADSAGLSRLAGEHLSVPGDKGANAGLKVTSLVAEMVAGADSIDDMALLRHGGMGRVFARAYAPSTLGSFLRAFSFGHVRQLDAVASRFLTNLTAQAPQVTGDGTGGRVLVDVDDTIIEVHGYAKQGAGFGYSKVRGLNALIATVTTAGSAPVWSSRGDCARDRAGPARGETAGRRRAQDRPQPARCCCRHVQAVAACGLGLLWGADGRCRAPWWSRCVGHGAHGPKVKAAIATISDDAWTPIQYTDAIYDEATGTWCRGPRSPRCPSPPSAPKKLTEQVPGRLVVRRIPDLNAQKKKSAGQGTLFDTWRFHAFFSTTDPAEVDTVSADKTHRGHAIIEQVHVDLKSSALAHLPSGKFTANAAWLVLAVIAFNLTRTAATITGTALAKATTATITGTS